MHKLNTIIKDYLQENPYDPNDPSTLPTGWEIRFGIRGKFLKYDSVEHAERRNMTTIRETGENIPFGYANKCWEKLKANLLPNDEIWKIGNDGFISMYIIRDGGLVTYMCGQYKCPKNGYYVMLRCS